MTLKFSFISVLACMLVTQVWAQPKAVKLSLDMEIPALRWGQTKGKKRALKGVSHYLYLAKKAERERNPKSCLLSLERARKQSVTLRPWILAQKLSCAKLAVDLRRHKLEPLEQALHEVEANPQWMHQGPFGETLRHRYIESYLLLLDRQVDGNRKKAWKNINQLLVWKSWFSSIQAAEIYRIAGELAFVQQDFSAAADFIRRSLREKPSLSLQEKLESIQKNFTLPKAEVSQRSIVPRVTDADLESTEKERKLYAEMQKNLRTGDLVSAVEDGVDLIRKFPGGSRADWAQKRISSVFFSVARKRDKKYALIRQRIFKQMQQVDGERQVKWARRLYSRGFYKDAKLLAQKAYVKLEGLKASTEAGLLAAEGAVSSGDYSEAEEYFQKVIDHHSGTEAAREAIYRLGLLFVRIKKYDKASAFFERYLAVPESDNYELQARHWLWRSQQKLGNSERASKLAKALWQRFPLTYYGLRARAEANGQKLSWPQSNKKPEAIEVRLWLTESETRVWERYKILVNSGWFTEAQKEISFLPKPRSPKELLIYAKLYAVAFNHYEASILAHKAWEQDMNLLNDRWLNIIYPREFSDTVAVQAKKNSLDSFVIWAVIKQESSYRADAISPASAMGLMQLMPPTAREVARYLGVKKLRLPEDMFDPDKNIAFGSHYLRRMLRAFGGHLPLALASYNVGIGNIRRWMGSRPDLKRLQEKGTSLPENEIWIDELPWDETSFYVKAILRNYLIYKMLDKREVSLSDPVWKI